jgi:hypothetical protein
MGYTTGEGTWNYSTDQNPNLLSGQEAFRSCMQEHNPDCKLHENDESENSAALTDFIHNMPCHPWPTSWLDT